MPPQKVRCIPHYAFLAHTDSTAAGLLTVLVAEPVGTPRQDILEKITKTPGIEINISRSTRSESQAADLFKKSYSAGGASLVE